MEIYLVRHTTPNIEKGICYGQSDLGVTVSFDTEVTHIHSQIPVEEITQVYSSPLQRCKLLAETFKKPVIFDNRLKELNFGDWELKAWDEISEEEIRPWMNDFVNVSAPEGESYITLQQRVLDFFSDLDSSSSDKIIIVSHAGPMRSLIAQIQNITLKNSFSIKLGYGQIIKINAIDGNLTITDLS
ncbi:alpha-ribazole phosphatase [Aquimarina sp. 2201CG5-10]|uniref:alpha-ribazole phosphatase n=1 Tax=Aquimarina callyspongiae TaxID=3098150 RepID=UPI002AB32F70|nr:alpha-ribazole phosphatase [Aquimarina sp. 2201CG5-10]MDY8138888.1 alpha-ribazole phosphatase [Aquimarina sp. 2201CG5-10]